MAASPPGTLSGKSVTAQEVIDIIGFDDPTQARFKKVVFELKQQVADADFAEDFLDKGGLDQLLRLVRSTSGTVQGLLLQAVHALLVYLNALERFDESPELVDRIYGLLLPPDSSTPINLTVAKAALQVLVVICGKLDKGHQLINDAAKRKMGTEGLPYAPLGPLLSSNDLICVSNTLLLMNLLVSKRRAVSDMKVKRLVFKWQQAGLTSLLKPLETLEDPTILKQLTVLQKSTGIVIPKSWLEAHKFKQQYLDIKRRYDNANEQLFVLQQQQAKVRLMKLEFQRAQVTLRALGVVMPTASITPHPTKRFSEGGGLALRQLANPAQEPIDIDATDIKETTAIQKKLLEALLKQPDMAALAEHIIVPHGTVPRGSAGGGPRRGGGGGGAYGHLYLHDDMDFPPPPDQGSDDDDLPPPDDDDDDLPPPDDDDDDAPPLDDDLDAPPGGEGGARAPPRAGGGPAAAAARAAAADGGAAGAADGAVGGHVDPAAGTGTSAGAADGGVSAAAHAPGAAAPFGEAQVGAAAVGAKAPAAGGPPGPSKSGPPMPSAGGPPLKGPPGPKLGGPPGVKAGPGPAAAAAAARQYYKGPAPDKKMKALHWDKMPLAADLEADSVWGIIHSGKVNAEFDYEEFGNLFAHREIEKKEAGPKKEVKRMIIDPRAFQNLAIMLHKLPRIPTIQNAVLSMDSSVLQPAMIQAMADPKVLPPEIVKEFVQRQNEKEVGEYDPPEQFIAMTLTIPCFQQRCQAWLFTTHWEESVEAARQPMTQVKEAIECILSSTHLPIVLGVLLNLGNMMNHGSTKGNAGALALSSIAKADGTKDNRGKTTVIQYLIDSIRKREPDAMVVAEELKPMLAASNAKLEDVTKATNEAQRQLTVFKNDVAAVKKATEASGADADDDPFVPFTAEFLVKASNDCAALKASCDEVVALNVRLQRYFGLIGAKAGKPEDIFSALTPMLQRFKTAADADARDKRKTARKGQKLNGDLKNVLGELEQQIIGA